MKKIILLITGFSLAITQNNSWGFDIEITFAALGQEFVEDTGIRLGFRDDASNGYDSDWDIPNTEVGVGNHVDFFIENDFSLEIEYIEWEHDIRHLNDDLYSSNYTTVFEGRLEANIVGMAILHTIPYAEGIQFPDSFDIPVYVEVNGHHYFIANDGVNGDNSIPININENQVISVRFIVGNLVPEPVNNMTVVSQDLIDQSQYVDTPSIVVSWDEDFSCEDIIEESIVYNESTGLFEPAIYNNVVCNSHGQRYPANAYQLYSHHTNDAGDSASWNFEAGIDASHTFEEEGLEYGTEYGYTIRSLNNAGEGGSLIGIAITASNQANTAVATNSLDMDANEAECTGNHCENQISDTLGDNVYTPLHDGDEVNAQVEITLNGYSTDPEDYPIDLVWSCISGCTGFYPSPYSAADQAGLTVDDVASITSTFIVDNPYGNLPKTMTFELAAIDDNWLTNGSNGYHDASDQVTIHINSEQNQRPFNAISINPDSASNDFSPFSGGDTLWQVPWDGDPLTNTAQISLLFTASDPDGDAIQTIFKDINSDDSIYESFGNLNEFVFTFSLTADTNQYDYNIITIDNYGDSIITNFPIYVLPEYTVSCTDSLAANYNPWSDVDDGSCQYANPIITNIIDQPDDDGGYVLISFIKSFYDDTLQNNQTYSVDRLDGNDWLHVLSAPAYGDSSYDILVSTSMDMVDNYFRVWALMEAGNFCSNTSSGMSINNILGLTSNTDIPDKFILAPAYPNPFNPVTTISFGVPDPIPAFPSTGEGEKKQSEIRLQIYDITGRTVETLIDGIVEPGKHSVEWNADGLPSGVYFVKMNAGEFSQSQKLMLIK